MAETLTDSGAVKIKAGANASSTVTDDPTTMTALINQAEGVIAAETLIDWVAIYASLSSNTKKVLDSAASSYAAMSVVGYDMGGYTGGAREGETVLDKCVWEFDNAMNRLKEDKVKGLLGAT